MARAPTAPSYMACHLAIPPRLWALFTSKRILGAAGLVVVLKRTTHLPRSGRTRGWIADGVRLLKATLALDWKTAFSRPAINGMILINISEHLKIFDLGSRP